MSPDRGILFVVVSVSPALAVSPVSSDDPARVTRGDQGQFVFDVRHELRTDKELTLLVITSTLETLILYLLILLGIAFTFVAATRLRGITLREIPAYDAMRSAAGEAVEADRPIHVSLGSAAIGQDSTVAALAGAEILQFMAERAAIGERPTLATVSNPITLGVAQDALRRAYKVRGRLNDFRPAYARWYPQGPLSLAFAAGVGAAIRDENILGNVLIGRFGAELALVAENALRLDNQIIAQSDRPEGQAVAYAISKTPLIGEELYVSSGYLQKNPLGIGGVVALDLLRYVVITGLILAALYNFVTGGR